MKVLYCAIDQSVPGTTGGSVHVEAIASGLVKLGHDVHVLASPGDGEFPANGARWIAMNPPLGRKELRWLRAPAVKRLARTFRPDAVIERYYNFGGEGIAAAKATGALGVLEVNAPVIDYAGSPKTTLDKAVIFEPMRRWRERLCREAGLIVTPSAAILPASTSRDKILEIEWGADTSQFRPGASGSLRFERPRGLLVVFAGAFRSWHGAVHLVRAIRQLRERGRRDISAVLIGEGPELHDVQEEAKGIDGVIFTGPLPHDEVPAHLAAADVGVAPFDVDAHQPLSLGFYWSPLKIFEYMAAGLPVVAPSIDRISTLVRDGVDGILYSPGDPAGLANALESLTDNARRATLGQSARVRAVTLYSWAAHCRALEAAIERARARTAAHR